MSVHSNDDLSLGFADPPIQPRGNDLFRIVENPEGRESLFKFAKDQPRTIVAHAIGHQDFHFDPAKVLAKNGIEKRANVPDFVAAGDNYGDMNCGPLLHGPFLSHHGT